MPNPGDVHGYVYQSIGANLVNPGDVHGYVYLYVVQGAGYTLYPYRESPDLPALSRY